VKTTVEAAGVHYRQWRTLTKTALTIDFRAIFMAGRKSTLELRLAGMVLHYVIISTLLGAAIAAPVWLVPDPGYAAAAVVSAIMFFGALIGVSEQGSSILSPADASIVGSRPVSSRTFFSARLTSLLIYGTAQITSLAWLAVMSFAIRHPPLTFGAFVVALYAASTLTLLGLVLIKLTLLAILRPASITGALAWLQVLVVLPFVGLIPLIYPFADGIDWHALRLPAGLPGLAYPPAWFAALVQLAGAQATSGQRLASVTPFALTAATVAGIGIASRGYLERLMALEAGSTPARRRTRSDPWRRFRSHETRAIVILIRGHLRSDGTFRAGVITSIVMNVLMPVCFLWGMGSDQAFGSSAGVFVTVPVASSTALLRLLSQSPSWPASWPLFAAPASQFRIVRAALRLLWSVGALPTIVLLYALTTFWGLGGGRTLGQFLLIAMGAYTAMLLDTVRSPALPFSQRPIGPGTVQRAFPMLPSLVMGVSAVLIMLAAWHVGLLVGLMMLFVSAILGLERLLRLRLEQSPLLVEGEE
jgi:hypothetical protein